MATGLTPPGESARPVQASWYGPGLLRIVDRSHTIGERVGCGQLTAHTDTEPDQMARWRERVARGDHVRFRRRLRWEPPEPKPAPAWTGVLEDIFAALERFHATTSGDTLFNAGTPPPFAELLLPLVDVARRRLAARASVARLTSEAHADLARGLLTYLAFLCEQTLHAEFAVYRAARWQATLTPDDGADSRLVYDAFVARMREGGLADVLTRYPVLARLLATRIAFWVDAIEEFFVRLGADAAAIRAAFRQPEDASLRVIGIRPGLSDSHHRGRTVLAVTFACGLRVIYKPRSLAAEAAFARLLDAVNQAGADLPLRTLTVLDRSTHGWVEAAEWEACADAAAAGRFYRRAGMLLGLTYVLGGSDFHQDNVRACGEHPVLLDLEVATASPLAEKAASRTEPTDSVLRSGLLPRTVAGGAGPYAIAGGLVDAGMTAALPTRLLHVNTDRMCWGQEAVAGVSPMNLPSVGGRAVPALAHVAEIQDGFRSTCRLLRQSADAWLEPDGPLRVFERLAFRVVRRPTAIYHHLLVRSLHPALLGDGMSRSMELDLLSAAALDSAEPPPGWKSVVAERAALEQLDIPIFVVTPDSLHVKDADGCGLDETVTEPAWHGIVRRIRALDESAIDAQVALIGLSFAAAAVRTERLASRLAAPTQRDGVRDYDAEVAAIADLLARVAVARGEGVGWLSADGGARSGSDLREVDVDLFHGASGIALFLAAAAAITGADGAGRVARCAVAPIVRQLADPAGRAALVARLGIGGAAGVGGVIYALTRISTWIDAPEILEAARQALSAITADVISADRHFDVVFGSAGALLGALAFYDATGDRQALAQAIACGDRLLASRTVDPDSGLRTWTTTGDRRRSGFAHGAAGIVYALSRLASTAGQPAYRRAALEAARFEGGLFVECAKNWREHDAATPDSAGAQWIAWCHGAVGIGLARLAAASPTGDAPLHLDLERALAGTIDRAPAATDHLCCGNLGRADFLLEAGTRLRRGALVAAARRIADEAIARASAAGGYRVGGDEMLRPSLFQGLAGVGYQLLRLDHPNQVPSVLLWG